MISYEPNASDLDYLKLKNAPSDPDLHIKAGDMIFLDFYAKEWTENMTNGRVAELRRAYPAIVPRNTEGASWKIEPLPHDAPRELKNTSRHLGRFDNLTGETITISRPTYMGTENLRAAYHIFDPNETYVLELWAKQDSMTNPEINITWPGPSNTSFPEMKITPTQTLQKHSIEFTVSKKQTNSAAGFHKHRIFWHRHPMAGQYPRLQ